MSERWLALRSTPDIVGKLEKLGVPLITVHIEAPGPMEVISFPEDSLDKVMKVIMVGVARARTNVPNVILCSVLASADSAAQFEPIVRIESTENIDGSQTMIEDVLMRYSAALRKNISVRNLHGKPWDGQSVVGGWIRVMFWATPGPNSSSHTKIPRVFGHRLHEDGQNDGVVPDMREDRNIVNVIDTDGQIVAQVRGGNELFILFDLPHGGATNVEELLVAIMDASMRYLGGDAAAVTVDPIEFKLQKLFNRSKDKLLADHKAGLLTFDSRIATATKQLSDNLLAKADSICVIKALESSAGDAERAAKEYKALSMLDKVKEVSVIVDRIVVKTEPLAFTYGGKVRPIGEMSITLIPGKNYVLIQSNKPVERYSHPHVDTSDVPCFGNLQAGVMKMISELEFAAAVQVIMQFLQTCNTEGFYVDPRRWPTQEDIDKKTAAVAAASPVVSTVSSVDPPVIDHTIADDDNDDDDEEDESDESDESEEEEHDDDGICYGAIVPPVNDGHSEDEATCSHPSCVRRREVEARARELDAEPIILAAGGAVRT